MVWLGVIRMIRLPLRNAAKGPKHMISKSLLSFSGIIQQTYVCIGCITVAQSTHRQFAVETPQADENAILEDPESVISDPYK